MNLAEEKLSSEPFDAESDPSDREKAAERLLSNIKSQLPALEQLLSHLENEWGIEDGFYRFYHQSFKVYALQQMTEEICNALRNLLPGYSLNDWFQKIVAEGTNREFEISHNNDWLRHTRPILEACFHAHLFLKTAVKCGHELQSVPNQLPGYWAALLYLFNLR